MLNMSSEHVNQHSNLTRYFLCVSIMQMIPSWSTTGSYTTIIPLLIFISISMGREAFDDWRRHRQDKEENNRLVDVAELNVDIMPDEDDPDAESPIKYVPREWKDLQVGDIIRVKQNEWVPADIVLLYSEGYEGQTYVETMALDGETNMKTKAAFPELATACSTARGLAVLKASILAEDPNLDLYNFEGSLTLDSKEYPLNLSHIVYRGSVLRNTPSCLGLIVFSGEECKIRMNSIQNPRSKAPRLQGRANKIVIFMVCFVILLSVFCTIAWKVYVSTTGNSMWFLENGQVGVVPTLMGFIIMFNTLVPLSLYVTMEIIRVFQMVILQMDIDMYHEPSNTPCEARTASINEELGQVSYIFSDKTGTLTDNVMFFRKLSVAGEAWIHDLDLQLAANERVYQKAQKKRLKGRAMAAPADESSSHVRKAEAFSVLSHKQCADANTGSASRASTDAILRQVAALPRKSTTIRRPSMASLTRTISGSTTWRSTANPAKAQQSRSTLELLEYILGHPHSIFAKKAKFLLLSIALCHECVVERDERRNDDGSYKIDNLEYQSASPDEVALLSAARDMGYLMIDRKHNSITLRTYPNGFDEGRVDEVYEVLEIIEFSSARKRMSIVVKFPDGRFCVISKGADNVILERLRQAILARAKAEEINRQTIQRKAAEAEVVIARNSISSLGQTSISGGGRLSVSRPSINIDRKDALASLDCHLQRAHGEDVGQVAETSRRSISLARQRKYGQNGRSSIDGGKSRDFKRSFDGAVEQDHELLEIDDHLVLDDGYVISKTLEHVEEFSTEGLRTLLYAYRWLTKEEYDSWIKLYRDARTSLVDRQDKVEKVGEMIEHDYELCGATAIEDRLQEGVPEAIEKLRRAKIKLWMLTGDKRETAINIGYSCRLIYDYSTVVVLRSDEGDVAGKMAAAMLELDSGDVAHCVVVIDGMTLAQIEEDMTLMTLFIELGVKADSVICCRASPSQKSSMVLAVRNKVKSSITLAIGDGANDIAMIQSADVGIGITGKEGLQAARASDFSIAQFRFLLKLLLVHGRWNYVRTCKYILGTFYKEFFFYLTQAIYQSNTMFSGTSIYEKWSLSMFNTLFTSLPVLCIGIFEQDLTPPTLIAVPELYSKGQQNQGFGLVMFIGWITVAACESVMVSFLTYYLYGFHALIGNTIYPLGVISFTSIIMMITTKLQFLEMHRISMINVATSVISVGGWFVWDMLLSYVYSKKPSKIYFVGKALFTRFGTELSFWTTILIIFAIGICFEILVRLVRNKVLPTETDTFQILEKNPAIRRRLEEESFEELKQGLEGKQDVESSDMSTEVSSMFSLPPRPRKRDIIARKFRFARRRSSNDDEREVQEILQRRERELQEMDA